MIWEGLLTLPGLSEGDLVVSASAVADERVLSFASSREREGVIPQADELTESLHKLSWPQCGASKSYHRRTASVSNHIL